MTCILVCGGRHFNDPDLVFSVLEQVKPSHLIHGGATGADRLASWWASEREIMQTEYKPAWSQHGRAAGPIRNQFMLDDGKPDLVIAFPGGRGTADMVRRARAAGVEVRMIPLPEIARLNGQVGG